MERIASARLARGIFRTLLVAVAIGALGAGSALAKPGLGAAPKLPIIGSSVNLGCANPANIGRTGSVLAAAEAPPAAS